MVAVCPFSFTDFSPQTLLCVSSYSGPRNIQNNKRPAPTFSFPKLTLYCHSMPPPVPIVAHSVIAAQTLPVLSDRPTIARLCKTT